MIIVLLLSALQNLRKCVVFRSAFRSIDADVDEKLLVIGVLVLLKI